MEIAGDNALYFNGLEPIDLANAIEEWISLYNSGKAPDSSKIELRTWKDCAEEVYGLLGK